LCIARQCTMPELLFANRGRIVETLEWNLLVQSALLGVEEVGGEGLRSFAGWSDRSVFARIPNGH